MKRIKYIVAAALAVAALAMPTAAFAQAGVSGYSTQAGAVQGQINNTSASAGESAGGLPFTGMDLAIIAAAGVMLASLGVGLRRLTHSPREA